MTILSIVRGEYTSAVHQATQIGQDCDNLDNIVTAQFISSLFLRTARLLQTTYSATDDAICCCRCARHCLQSAGDDVFQFQAYLAEMTAFITMGDGQNALALFYESVAVKDRADKYIGNLEAMCDGLQQKLLEATAISLWQTWVSSAKSVFATARMPPPAVDSRSSDGRTEQMTFDDMHDQLYNAGGLRRSPEQLLRDWPAFKRLGQDLTKEVALVAACDQLTESRLRAESAHFRHLGDANVEAAESCLHDFIEVCKKSKARLELAHNFAVLAYFGLGDAPSAKSWLPPAILADFGGVAPPRQACYQSGLFFQGSVAKNDFDCEHVHTAIGLVCLAEAWSMGIPY